MERDQTNCRHSLARNFPPCRQLATRTKLAKNRALQISGMGQDQASAPRVSDGFLKFNHSSTDHASSANGNVKFFALNIFHTHKQCFSIFWLYSDATSWRDGGGRGPILPGEGTVEGGPGGNVVMDGVAGGPPPNPQSHGPPRNPPAGSPALPLGQPPVGPGFPQYRGIMAPFVSISHGAFFQVCVI